MLDCEFSCKGKDPAKTIDDILRYHQWPAMLVDEMRCLHKYKLRISGDPNAGRCAQVCKDPVSHRPLSWEKMAGIQLSLENNFN
jgi:hypothetical protein